MSQQSSCRSDTDPCSRSAFCVVNSLSGALAFGDHRTRPVVAKRQRPEGFTLTFKTAAQYWPTTASPVSEWRVLVSFMVICRTQEHAILELRTSPRVLEILPRPVNFAEGKILPGNSTGVASAPSRLHVIRKQKTRFVLPSPQMRSKGPGNRRASAGEPAQDGSPAEAEFGMFTQTTPSPSGQEGPLTYQVPFRSAALMSLETLPRPWK
ncbi:hypothetical protein Deipe_4270 (plasmid) [Deinococcus peraridilitoris DSM 19664]|uniref:Uncharacterized protein n=1 Tax=Deinococcus peraridilitoris (strain DSM 19664 / LMG 22246 / CIP 109416 / KR-200) TaxID=937777 RepID=L0A6Y9_DEIPD|nr:hypothetical protein Deipe_4270 [Deinococcus peraridilitoris DSM 19664]